MTVSKGLRPTEYDSTFAQLEELKDDCAFQIRHNVTKASKRVNWVVGFLSNCDSAFRTYQYSYFILNEEIISDNFFRLLLNAMTWKNLSENSALFSVAYNTLTVICRHYPKRIRTLESMGLWSRVRQILEAEENSELELECQGQDGHVIYSSHLISEFLPPLEHSACHRDLNDIEEGLIYKGRQWTGNQMAEITHTAESLFPTMMRLCKTENFYNIHLVILYKMVYWTDMYGTLERFTSIGDLLGLVKSLILMRDNWDVTLIGFALARVLKERHIKDFLSEKFHLTTNQLLSGGLLYNLCGRYTWIEEVYAVETTYWLLPAEIEPHAKMTSELGSGIQFVTRIFDFLMSDMSRSIQDRYQRLRIFFLYILGNIEESRDREAILSRNGITNFEVQVTKVVDALDAIQVDQIYIHFVPDLFDLVYFANAPTSPKDVRLGLFESLQFDRVLGPSQNPLELATNPLMKALRVLSILHEVNENWNVLFGYLTGKRIVDRDCFISKIFEKLLKCTMASVNYRNTLLVPSSLVKLAANFPFIFSYVQRQWLFRFLVRWNINAVGPIREKVLFGVPRNNLVSAVSRHLNAFNKFSWHTSWTFEFSGESGTGPGPTKEFYAEFSRDCQKYRLGLWYGEPLENGDGVQYTSSTCGLFPVHHAPFDRKDSLDRALFSVGIIIGKSLVEEHLMDVRFSPAFYKLLFGIKPKYQQLFLSDLKDVLPTAFSFVESLTRPLIQKWKIENNGYLTAWEKRQQLDAITVDGCTFEDLCVNFTVPGLLPEVELMENGTDVYLNIDNLESYLQLLVYNVLCEGQKKNFGLLKSGLNHSFTKKIKIMFMADEMERLLRGVKVEQWSVDYLMQNCVMSEGLSVESPAVRYLFEVLSELTGDEQSLFVRFTTSSPTLPYGGLSSLNPRLTIARKVPLSGDHDACLPSSSTCYNTLFIADYSNKEVLKKKLLLAINDGNNLFEFF